MNTQSGFSMLEVLISIFVLAVGLLGLMTLQMNSLKNNHSAQHRTTAVILAYDIFDRMRVNNIVDYSLAMSASPSGSTLKDTDLISWINDLSSNLPSGDGSVDVSDGVVTVVVQWDDSRGTEGDAQQQFTVSSER